MTQAAEPAVGAETAKNRTILIRAEKLRKTYGPVVAVSELTFEVRRGEILGLLGPNGAGKSTALRMLIGFQYPDAGKALLHGEDAFQDGPVARRALGYLPESVPLYADMEVRRYLEFFARVKRVNEPRAEVKRVIHRLDLKGVEHRPCGNISRGYRQRVGLAQALLGDPSILILDEPTSGLDPNQIHDFRQLLRDLGRERAILLSTHILPEAIEVCDRVLIMSRGKVVAEGSPADLAGSGQVHFVRLRLPSAPQPAEAGRFGLQKEGPEGTATAAVQGSGSGARGTAAATGAPAARGEGGAGIYRIRAALDRAEAQALLRLAVERNWEVLEWGAGAAALETVFRRLTLGGEEP